MIKREKAERIKKCRIFLCIKQANARQKKSIFFNEKYFRIFWGKKSEERASTHYKDRTERVTGLSMRTRQEIAMWNHKIA